MQLRDWIFGLFGAAARTAEGQPRARGQAMHVIILDGTASSLVDSYETHAGMTYKLLNEAGQQANLTVHYEAGIQWRDWRGTWGVITGKGINRQIERAYGVLASRYKPGDQIVLIGYSRGAYAVRSLAGVIGVVGLVTGENATVRNIRTAYRHYRTGGRSKYAESFRTLYCHRRADTPIEAVAVWDTVKALGIRAPILWRWMKPAQPFHDHRLGPQVRNGFHAIALDETREAYAPVMWRSPTDWPANIEQVWFRGAHSDVGGQVGEYPAARPLSNISLVWMLSRLEDVGVPLPADWQGRFKTDVTAPARGSWRGWGKVFWARKRRLVGADASEKLHQTVDPTAYAKAFSGEYAQSSSETPSPQSS